jgi:hypothetical protein
MSNSQVTIRIDSRTFYGLIAVLATLGIGVLGFYIGTRLLASPTQPVVSAPGVAQNSGAVEQPAVAPGGSDVQSVPPSGGQAAPAVGIAPVSVEEVPVGENEPRLALPELADVNYTYDFGDIPANQTAEHAFTLANVGTAPLNIEKMSASCGCTVPNQPSQNPIPPGETATFRVSYDPRHNEEFGRFVSKQVKIHSNDPKAPVVEFTITANVASQ